MIQAAHVGIGVAGKEGMQVIFFHRITETLAIGRQGTFTICNKAVVSYYGRSTYDSLVLLRCGYLGQLPAQNIDVKIMSIEFVTRESTSILYHLANFAYSIFCIIPRGLKYLLILNIYLVFDIFSFLK